MLADLTISNSLLYFFNCSSKYIITSLFDEIWSSLSSIELDQVTIEDGESHKVVVHIILSGCLIRLTLACKALMSVLQTCISLHCLCSLLWSAFCC